MVISSIREVVATQSVEKWEFAKYDSSVDIKGKKDVKVKDIVSSQLIVSSIHWRSESI